MIENDLLPLKISLLKGPSSSLVLVLRDEDQRVHILHYLKRHLLADLNLF